MEIKYIFEHFDYIGFDLGYSTLEGNSYGSFIFLYSTYYKLQLMSFTNHIEKQYQQLVTYEAKFKFTQNYLIILQNNQLIINNFQNNIQKLNDLKVQVLGIDVDFQNDILIVLTFQQILESTNYKISIQFIKISQPMLQILLQLRMENKWLKQNIKYYQKQIITCIRFQAHQQPSITIKCTHHNPTQLVSGCNPELKVITEKQLLVDSQRYKSLRCLI